MDGVEGHAESGPGGVRTAQDDLGPDILLPLIALCETRGHAECVEVTKAIIITILSPVDVDRVPKEGRPVAESWAGRFS